MGQHYTYSWKTSNFLTDDPKGLVKRLRQCNLYTQTRKQEIDGKTFYSLESDRTTDLAFYPINEFEDIMEYGGEELEAAGYNIDEEGVTFFDVLTEFVSDDSPGIVMSMFCNGVCEETYAWKKGMKEAVSPESQPLEDLTKAQGIDIIE